MLHADATPFFVNYRDTLREAVLLEIVQPLCRDIETDLRLHIHTKHLGRPTVLYCDIYCVSYYFALAKYLVKFERLSHHQDPFFLRKSPTLT